MKSLVAFFLMVAVDQVLLSTEFLSTTNDDCGTSPNVFVQYVCYSDNSIGIGWSVSNFSSLFFFNRMVHDVESTNEQNGFFMTLINETNGFTSALYFKSSLEHNGSIITCHDQENLSSIATSEIIIVGAPSPKPELMSIYQDGWLVLSWSDYCCHIIDHYTLTITYTYSNGTSNDYTIETSDNVHNISVNVGMCITASVIAVDNIMRSSEPSNTAEYCHEDLSVDDFEIIRIDYGNATECCTDEITLFIQWQIQNFNKPIPINTTISWRFIGSNDTGFENTTEMFVYITDIPRKCSYNLTMILTIISHNLVGSAMVFNDTMYFPASTNANIDALTTDTPATDVPTTVTPSTDPSTMYPLYIIILPPSALAVLLIISLSINIAVFLHHKKGKVKNTDSAIAPYNDNAPTDNDNMIPLK